MKGWPTAERASPRGAATRGDSPLAAASTPAMSDFTIVGLASVTRLALAGLRSLTARQTGGSAARIVEQRPLTMRELTTLAQGDGSSQFSPPVHGILVQAERCNSGHLSCRPGNRTILFDKTHALHPRRTSRSEIDTSAIFFLQRPGARGLDHDWPCPV